MGCCGGGNGYNQYGNSGGCHGGRGFSIFNMLFIVGIILLIARAVF